MTETDIAQVAHEINKAYAASIGDYSQPSWEDAPDWQKKSAVQGVKFRLENPKAGPSVQHESWLKEKMEQGWKYGEVKNAEKKEHPCMVAYSQLPVEQRSKDHLFMAVVDNLKKFLGTAQARRVHDDSGDL